MESLKELEFDFFDFMYINGAIKMTKVPGCYSHYDDELSHYFTFTLEFFNITFIYSKDTLKLTKCDIFPHCWSKERMKQRKFQFEHSKEDKLKDLK